MKKIILILIVLISCLNLSFSMDIKGNFTMEDRFSLSNGDLLFNQENGTLKFEQQVDDNFYGMVKLGFKYYNNPLGVVSYSNTLSSYELGNLYSVQPLEIAIDEAYFTYSDFIFEKLDLTAGKQRIAWGTADRLNPTDILNPNDYSDPFDFGKKIPTTAVNLVYHFPVFESGIQLVYEPFAAIARENFFMDSQRKSGIYAGLVSNLSSGVTSFSDLSSGWDSEIAVTPPLNVSNFNIGAKFFGTLAGFDLSLNYATRINDIPYVSEMDINQTVNVRFTTGMTTNIILDSRAYQLNYYREHEVGFDFSKDLNFMLLWGEVALTIPPEQNSVMNALTIQDVNVPFPGGTNVSTNLIVNKQIVISNEPYIKYTIGLDKSFEGGFYINFQYNHGFFNERGNNGPERLQDYFLLRLEEKLFSDKLKFALTGFANINNLYDLFTSNNFGNYLSENYGILGQFSITYSPHPSVNIELGIIGIDGKDNSTLGKMKDNDQIYSKFEYSF